MQLIPTLYRSPEILGRKIWTSFKRWRFQKVREMWARKYLSGEGIEIGALHDGLAVPAKARVRYVDRMGREDLYRQYPELQGKPLVEVDIIDNGETLATLEASSFDFIIFNHILEHCENPILALKNHWRVLKDGGILYLAVPHRDKTFDKARALTSFAHLKNDFLQGPGISRHEHYQDWVTHVTQLPDCPLKAYPQRVSLRSHPRASAHYKAWLSGLDGGAKQKTYAQYLEEIHYSIHFHTWTTSSLVDFLSHQHEVSGCPFSILQQVENDYEIIVILSKSQPV